MANENERINISLDPEIAKQLRHAALEKYGNSRSLSKLIEDLAKGLNKIDIEEIKAARQKCATDLNDEMDKVFFRFGDYRSVCGASLFHDFRCKICDAEFQTTFSDARYCPSCHSDVIQIPTDENRLAARAKDDALDLGAEERCSKKVLNYILDELKAGHDPLLLSDVAEKFETSSIILKNLLSPLGIEAQQEEMSDRPYFSQDARIQIEMILAITEPWGSFDFSDYVYGLVDIKKKWENGIHDAEKIAKELSLDKEFVDARLRDLIKYGIIKE
jgi:hypothetical protein